MTVPNTFANATTAIPLVQLDQNFNTGVTLGNTTVFLGNTTTTLGNVTLTGANVTTKTLVLNGATSGSTTISPVDAVTATITLPSATGTLAALGTPSFTTGIGVGGTAAGAGGIAFPATQVAIADVNTLDDYEEGTWTPSLGGSTVYSARGGSYIKIGTLVYIECWLNITTIGTGSTSLVSGLPFTSAAQPNGNRGTFSVSYFTSLANNVIFIAAYVNASATTLQFQGIAAAGTSMSTIAIFGSSTQISFSGFYTAAN